MNKNLQIRRGLHENIPVLLEGEPGFSTDTKSLYIGTGEENVHIINETDLDNKVHFKNEPAKQFNFIKNEPIQDGLVVNAYRQDAKSIDTGITDTKWTVIFEGLTHDFTTMSTDNVWYIMGQEINTYFTTGAAVAGGVDKKGNVTFPHRDTKVKVGEKFKVVIVRDGDYYTIAINSEFKRIYIGELGKGKKLIVGHHGIPNYNNDGKAKGWFRTLVYNRPLSPQEIEHNLSVLNNTDSIKSLEVTKDDATTSYNFATTENHVEMSTGRTLHDEYMGVLKTMGKEFESADGSDITVENGLEARVISSEISGRTVKRVDLGEAWSDTNFVAVNATGINYETNYKIYNFTGLPVSVLLANPSKNQKINNGASIELSGSTINQIRGMTEDGWGVTATDRSKLKNGLCLVSGDISDKIDVGLSSTQAIITNNGQEYKFYEPTIQGKTKILKANKGTQEWVEIDNSETRDLARYDYKLESINGDFCGLYNVCDIIDISNKEKISYIKKIKLDDTFKINLHATSGDFTRFRIQSKEDDCKKGSELKCNNFKYVKENPSTPSEESIYSHTVDAFFDFWVHNTKASSVEQFKAWLKNNPTVIQYELNTPSIVKLTDEQFKQYESYKKVILLYDKLDKLTLDTNGNLEATYNFKKQLLNINDYDISEYNHQAIKEGMIGFNLKTKLTDAYYESRKIQNVGYCDMFGLHSLEYILTIENGFGLCIYSNGSMYGILPKSVLETQDIDGVKKFLKDKEFTIIYRTNEPCVVKIPKELVSPILTHYNNNISIGGSIKPSSYKLTLPTMDNSKKDFTLSLVNNWSGNAKAILTRDHKGKLICNLTAPESFNTLVTNLPEVLRPKAEKVVLGIKDTTPVAIKIAPDGTVKIPETVTGTIQIDATYEL